MQKYGVWINCPRMAVNELLADKNSETGIYQTEDITQAELSARQLLFVLRTAGATSDMSTSAVTLNEDNNPCREVKKYQLIGRQMVVESYE